ncbi:unnamed protein product, partial [Owenia fusiformis]
MTVLTKLMKHLIFLFKIYIFSAILMKLNLLSWNVDGVMQSALALDNVSSNYDIDICAISEHKLFNDNLYFVDSINNQYESFSRSDASLDPFNSFRRVKLERVLTSAREGHILNTDILNNIITDNLITTSNECVPHKEFRPF